MKSDQELLDYAKKNGLNAQNIDEHLKSQAQPTQTQPQNPDIQALLQKLSPNMQLSTGQSLGNAMSVFGGGKPIYDNTTKNNPYLEEFAKKTVDKQFENPEEEKLKLENLHSQIDARKAGFTVDPVTGETVKRPPASMQFGDTPTGSLTGDESGPDVLNKLGPNDRKTVEGLLNYSIDPIHHFSGMNGAKARNYYFQLAQAVDPTINEQTYPLQAKTRLDYGPAGKSGKNLTSYGTAIKHLGTLSHEQAGTPSSGNSYLEKGQRYLAKNWNAKSPENMAMTGEDAALTAVSGELSNIFKQSGGTDPEIDKWFNSYDRNAPHEAKLKFIQTGIDLMNGRKQALLDSYEGTMGKPYEGYSPDAQSVQPQQPQVGQTPSFQSEQEATQSGYKGVAMIGGRKAMIH